MRRGGGVGGKGRREMPGGVVAVRDEAKGRPGRVKPAGERAEAAGYGLFAAWLLDLRMGLKLSGTAFASRIGLSKTCYYRWEAGSVLPGRDHGRTLEKLAGLAGINQVSLYRLIFRSLVEEILWREGVTVARPVRLRIGKATAGLADLLRGGRAGR